jgi:thiol-disulfide isomerase/thioredoxin
VNRRAAISLGIVGTAAAAAGLGAALWQSRRHAEADATPGPADPHGLYGLAFQQPGGQLLALERFRGRPLLINFWATWCPPCIREMPALDRFARQFAGAGWQVVGLAVDQEKPVQQFLGRHPVSYSIALAGFEGIALSRALGNDNGGLPFTVALDGRGHLTQRHQGETQFEQLAAWATAAAQPAAAASR